MFTRQSHHGIITQTVHTLVQGFHTCSSWYTLSTDPNGPPTNLYQGMIQESVLRKNVELQQPNYSFKTFHTLNLCCSDHLIVSYWPLKPFVLIDFIVAGYLGSKFIQWPIRSSCKLLHRGEDHHLPVHDQPSHTINKSNNYYIFYHSLFLLILINHFKVMVLWSATWKKIA